MVGGVFTETVASLNILQFKSPFKAILTPYLPAVVAEKFVFPVSQYS